MYTCTSSIKKVFHCLGSDRSWTLRHVLKNVADGTDGRYERDSWTLDTAVAYRSYARWDCHRLLEFGKYFRFILREGSGVAQSCTLWDVGLCLYCSFFYHGNWLLQKKSLVPCWILLTSLDQKPVCMALGYFFSLIKGSTCSLVPRFPHSGTRTMKLCRRGEPGIFSHVSSVKGRKGIERI